MGACWWSGCWTTCAGGAWPLQMGLQMCLRERSGGARAGGAAASWPHPTSWPSTGFQARPAELLPPRPQPLKPSGCWVLEQLDNGRGGGDGEKGHVHCSDGEIKAQRCGVMSPRSHSTLVTRFETKGRSLDSWSALGMTGQQEG